MSEKAIKEKNRIGLPELLAPAGSFAHLKAAVAAGADGIYIGGRRFGARAYAENASTEEMIDALHYAHFYDRKVYMTVNTLFKEEEVGEELEEFLFPFYQAGLDGVIVQDMGAAARMRSSFPDLPLHGSTQMTVTDARGARAAARMGMTRVVPARELSLEEIKEIKATGIEVEVFVHGALCYCYSGQCLMSSNYGGRSGNRGRCAQPCRLPYDLYDRKGSRIGQGHLLSPKDLCALGLLPDLVEAGVDSLKIEGRMKNLEYVAGVTSIYRKYLDKLADSGRVAGPKEAAGKKGFLADPADMDLLADLYQREGFTSGYFNRHNGQDMMAVREPRHTGRRIGRVHSVRKNRITIELDHPGYKTGREGDGPPILSPGDLLIIPLEQMEEGNTKREQGKKSRRDKREEMALTLPSDLTSCSFQRGRAFYITLNASGAGRAEKGMTVYRRFHKRFSDDLHRLYIDQNKKREVEARFFAEAGRPSRLILSCDSIQIVRDGPVPEPSLRRPLKQEDIRKELGRSGDMPFRLTRAEIRLGESLFMPLSGLKEMRRQAYLALKEKMETRYDRGEKTEVSHIQSSSDRKISPIRVSGSTMAEGSSSFQADQAANPMKVAAVYKEEDLRYIVGRNFAQRISLSMDFFDEKSLDELARYVKEAGLSVRLSLPRITRSKKGKDGWIRQLKSHLQSGRFDEIEIHNINQAQLLHEWLEDKARTDRGKPSLLAGMSFYQWNSASVRTVEDLFPEIGARVLPAELSAEELGANSLAGRQEIEELVFGSYPLMVSAQCLKKTTGKCDKKPEILRLKRDGGIILPVSTHCRGCYNLIWKDRPLNRISRIREEGVRADRCLFDTFGLSKVELEDMISEAEQYLL